MTVTQLPPAQRPRERMHRFGPEALSESELLACVLGRGVAGESVLVTAQRLLARFRTLRGIADSSAEQLCGVHGVGPAKAAQLRAVMECARRITSGAAAERVPVATPEAAAEVVRPFLSDARREHVVAVLLDARHHLIRVSRVAIGSLTASLVHPRELFHDAIAASAAAVIVAHNHPSGDPQPSAHDLALTERLVEAGALLGIEVVDHLILGSRSVVSLKAAGLMGSRRAEKRRS
jgi:DNA repair protein RadC